MRATARGSYRTTSAYAEVVLVMFAAIIFIGMITGRDGRRQTRDAGLSVMGPLRPRRFRVERCWWQFATLGEWLKHK